MKTLKRFFIAAAVALIAGLTANAQYYQLANQVSNLITPALSGSGSYRGMVEVTGTTGIGTNRANFIGASTVQGYRYNNWFFMGAGLGVEAAMSRNAINKAPDQWNYATTRTKCMIPVFSDFRFYTGSDEGIAFYLDLKLGAAWLVGSKYFGLAEGYMSNGTQFYLKPSAGVRIPVTPGDKKHAFNVAVSYQLLTSNNSLTYYNNSVSLNNIGVTIGYEW